MQKWLLQVRQHGRIERPQDIQDLQSELDLFADDHHGVYDGWRFPR